jgi:tetratricopeptide (TPR) repeat protein
MKRGLLCLFIVLLVAAMALPLIAGYELTPEIQQEYLTNKKLIQKNPKSALFYFNYAVTLAYMGKIEEGASALNKVTDLDPKFVKKNLASFIAAAKKTPDDYRVRFRLAFLYYFNNDFDRSYRELELISKEADESYLRAWALGYMAVIRGDRQKRWKEALELCNRALDYEPDAYGLYAALAIAQKENGNTMSAVGSLMKALSLRGDFEKYEKKLFGEN